MEYVQLDPDDARPPYEQVAAVLRYLIQRGRLLPGEQLPSRAALAAGFKVAPMTVQRAVDELRKDGLVVSQHGKGVFVRSRPREDAESRCRTGSRLLREIHRSTGGRDPRCTECRDEFGQLRRWPCRTIAVVDVLDGSELGR